MTREEGGKALTDHAGGADDTYVVLFHVVSTSFELLFRIKTGCKPAHLLL